MDALSTIDVFSLKVLFFFFNTDHVMVPWKNCFLLFFFFEFCPMHVLPCAHVCIFNEKTKGKFPGEHHVV